MDVFSFSGLLIKHDLSCSNENLEKIKDELQSKKLTLRQERNVAIFIKLVIWVSCCVIDPLTFNFSDIFFYSICTSFIIELKKDKQRAFQRKIQSAEN